MIIYIICSIIINEGKRKRKIQRKNPNVKSDWGAGICVYIKGTHTKIFFLKFSEVYYGVI
jgi:hypothetical protein